MSKTNSKGEKQVPVLDIEWTEVNTELESWYGQIKGQDQAHIWRSGTNPKQYRAEMLSISHPKYGRYLSDHFNSLEKAKKWCHTKLVNFVSRIAK